MNLHMLNIKRRDAEIERLLDILEIQEDALKKFHAEIERLRAVVDAARKFVDHWPDGDYIVVLRDIRDIDEALAALERQNAK